MHILKNRWETQKNTEDLRVQADGTRTSEVLCIHMNSSRFNAVGLALTSQMDRPYLLYFTPNQVCIWEVWDTLKRKQMPTNELRENRCPPTNNHEREERRKRECRMTHQLMKKRRAHQTLNIEARQLNSTTECSPATTKNTDYRRANGPFLTTGSRISFGTSEFNAHRRSRKVSEQGHQPTISSPNCLPTNEKPGGIYHPVK